MKRKITTILMTLTLMFAFSGLYAHRTGNERRTVAQCNNVKHKKHCKACVLGKGKHFHPKLNRCHRNKGK